MHIRLWLYVNYYTTIVLTGLMQSESCVVALGMSFRILGAKMTSCETRFEELYKLGSASESFPLLKCCVPWFCGTGNSGLHGQPESSADPPSFPCAQLFGIWTRPTWQPYSGAFLLNSISSPSSASVVYVCLPQPRISFYWEQNRKCYSKQSNKSKDSCWSFILSLCKRISELYSLKLFIE